MISTNWSKLTTTPTLTAISVPPGGGTPWAINANQMDDNVYTFTGSDGWQLVPGVHLTFITVAENGMIWGVDGTNTAQNNIYIYSDNAWQQPIAGVLTSIVVGRGGDVWGINTTIDPSNNSNIFKYVGDVNTWMSIPGYLTHIAVGSDGTIWGINTNLTNNNIFKYVGTLGQPWQPYATGQLPNLTQIAVGGDNSVWGIDNASNIWGLDEVLGFQQISGSAIWISAGEVNNVWAIATDGSTIVTSFPDLELVVELDNRPVYHARYAAHGSVGQRIMPGVRVPLKLVAEEWLDERFRDAQEHVRQRINTQSPTDLTITKFAWDILKDGKPTWGGEHTTQSSVLNPSDSNWTHYAGATKGHSETVVAQWWNSFSMVVGRVKMQLAGHYKAAPQAAGITNGYYIPDIHFELKEPEHLWGFTLSGHAQISNVSNEGGVNQPVDPSVTITATFEVSSLLSSASKTYYFAVTGSTGFAVEV